MAATQRAKIAGYIAAETKTTLIRFDDGGIEYQVGMTSKPLPCGALWSLFICPQCNGRAQRFACSWRSVVLQVRQGERFDLSFTVGAHREAPCGHRASAARPAQQRQAIACPSSDLAGRSTVAQTSSSRCGVRGSSLANMALIAPKIKDSNHGAAGQTDCQSVAHLDVEIVSAALICHDANIGSAARALGVPSGDLRKLVLVDQRLADAALEAVELRLDDAEANLHEALHCGDPRRRDAASTFMLRNVQRAAKRGYAVSASATSLEMNINAPPTHYTVVWGKPDEPDRELGPGEFAAMGGTYRRRTMAAVIRMPISATMLSRASFPTGHDDRARDGGHRGAGAAVVEAIEPVPPPPAPIRRRPL